MFKSILVLNKILLFLCFIQGSSCKATEVTNDNNLISVFFIQEEQIKKGDIVGINKKSGKVRPYRIGDYVIGIAPKQQNQKKALVSVVGALAFNREQVQIYKAEVLTKDGQLIGKLLNNQKVYINIGSNVNVNPILKKIKILRSLIKAEKLRNEIQTKQIKELQSKLEKLTNSQ